MIKTSYLKIQTLDVILYKKIKSLKKIVDVNKTLILTPFFRQKKRGFYISKLKYEDKIHLNKSKEMKF